MHPIVKWSLATAAAAVALAALVPAAIWLQAEAVIEQHYPLPSTTIRPDDTVKAVARGAHLVTVAGCTTCHGTNLEGRLLHRDTVLPIWSSNLTRHDLAVDEFERALRYGITPASTSTWAMPAMDYTYLNEDDLAAIVGYLNTRPAAGPARPGPVFDLKARLAVASGDLEPIVQVAIEAPSSLDLGPRYDGGRYLARIACSDCHGTDLTGSRTAPDLAAVARYKESALFALLREGRSADGRPVPVMKQLAKTRFHVLFDYEIGALYDYLCARAKIMVPLLAKPTVRTR